MKEVLQRRDASNRRLSMGEEVDGKRNEEEEDGIDKRLKRIKVE